ncbi:MAG: hypothetical protein RI907_1276 [Pseudomonadota bacterium]|jgi:hypothetical protein
MQRTQAALIALILSVATAVPALAEEANVGKTREQVRAELLEAIRTGDILVTDDSGRKLKDIYPSNYQAATATAKSAGQDKAVTAAAGASKAQASH